MTTKGNRVWTTLIEFYDILEHVERNGYFEITSEMIKAPTNNAEPRLHTKYDFENQRPKILKDNKLSILPIENGKYVIGKFENYFDIDASDNSFLLDVQNVTVPSWIQTLNHEDITSENTMLNLAITTGMIESMFPDSYVNNKSAYIETLTGRRRTGEFDFKISNLNGDKIQFNIPELNSPQYEVDSGIETLNELILIEAKNRRTDNFLIRQLYYPFRVWHNKVSKPVIPLYLQHSDGIYNFSIFRFADVRDYSSIELVSRHNFRISSILIDEHELFEMIYNTPIRPEPIIDDETKAPFPQADNLDVVFALLEGLADAEDMSMTTSEITDLLEYAPRQSAYYGSAIRYLGFATKDYNTTILSEDGKHLVKLPLKLRNKAVYERILSMRAFNNYAKHLYETGQALHTSFIEQMIEDAGIFDIHGIGNSTKYRRAGTVKGWVESIFKIAQVKYL